jgi:hypothetical protein
VAEFCALARALEDEQPPAEAPERAGDHRPRR